MSRRWCCAPGSITMRFWNRGRLQQPTRTRHSFEWRSSVLFPWRLCSRNLRNTPMLKVRVVFSTSALSRKPLFSGLESQECLQIRWHDSSKVHFDTRVSCDGWHPAAVALIVKAVVRISIISGIQIFWSLQLCFCTVCLSKNTGDAAPSLCCCFYLTHKPALRASA